MKRLGLFGGTFNPIHLAHTSLALGAAEELGLDKVLLIPTKTPPHKPAVDLADGEHRLAMCRLAAASHPILEVSDLELRRSEPSYTVTTLEQLKVLYPDAELFLIVGGDMLLSFDTWKRWQEVLALATLCAAPRTKEQYHVLAESRPALEAKGIHFTLLHHPVLEMSSTQVRQRVRRGESLEGFVDSRVAEYIRRHRLYLEA